jgi:polyisoprenoid-binding protein YceI
MAAEQRAGVGHHVVLSIVGVDRLAENGYFRAKLAQEQLVRDSGIPYTIVHATQFFEFLGSIADAATDGRTVRLSPALVQPMAADDVARAVADIAEDAPLNGMVEIAGPEQLRLCDLAGRLLAATQDTRRVEPDPQARYFGALLDDAALVAGPDARLGATGFDAWFAAHASKSHNSPANTDLHAVRAGHYVIDPAHTRLLFSVSHFGFSTFFGEFTRPTGTLHFDPHNLAATKLSVSVPVANIATANAILDEELRGGDWLDGERYPLIELHSTQVLAIPGGLKVHALLSLHGVTRPVQMDVTFVGAGINPKNERYTVGFDVRGSIRRGDYGVDAAPLIGNQLGLLISAAFEYGSA